MMAYSLQNLTLGPFPNSLSNQTHTYIVASDMQVQTEK